MKAAYGGWLPWLPADGYRNRGYESEGERRSGMLLGPVHLVVLALDNDKMRG
jgi:hypothetical protein